MGGMGGMMGGMNQMMGGGMGGGMGGMGGGMMGGMGGGMGGGMFNVPAEKLDDVRTITLGARKSDQLPKSPPFASSTANAIRDRQSPMKFARLSRS